MSCLVINRQRTVRIDTKKLAAEFDQLLKKLGYQDYALEIVCVGSARIRALHRAHFNDPTDTNVISFPHQKVRAGQHVPADRYGNKILGEIFLGMPFIAAEAPTWDRSVGAHTRHVIIHGLCHLLGYQHETATQERHMLMAQDRLYGLLCTKD